MQKLSQQGERGRPERSQQELVGHQKERRSEGEGDAFQAAKHPAEMLRSKRPAKVLRRRGPARNNSAGHLLHTGLEGPSGPRLSIQCES